MTHRPQLVVDNDQMRADTAALFDWLRGIAEDSRLPASAFRIAFLISQHVNRQSGTAWPSQESLAKLASVSVDSVRRAVISLVECGYLTASPGRGRGHSTEYRMAFENPATVQGFQPEKPASVQGIVRENPATVQGFDDLKPCKIPDKTLQKEGTNYYKNHQKERDIYPPLSSTRPKAPASEPDQDFDRFWSQYPRKVARPAAEKAWRSARKKASAAEIIAGVLRYAAERDGQDPTYTKHPSTWLNGECWADEPTPPRAGPHPQQSLGRTYDPAIAAVLGEGR